MTTLGGVPFTLARQYDSLARDARHGSVRRRLGSSSAATCASRPTSRPPAASSSACSTRSADGTRLYLTLPTGERAGFTFTPVLHTIGGVSVYRPSWLSDSGHGWTLASAGATLAKAGAGYIDSAIGLPYNAASPQFPGADYVLTAPDGTRYLLDSARGTTEIHTAAGGRLYFGASGVTGANGEALQFAQDVAGRLARVTGPDGATVVYQYDPAGRLAGVRDLADGTGSRYAYDEDGRLAAAVAIGGVGESIEYGTGGTVSVEAIEADLGGAAQFTGRTVGGQLDAGESAAFTFSVRASELAAAAGGRLIVRIAVDAAPGLALGNPQVAGVATLSLDALGPPDRRAVRLGAGRTVPPTPRGGRGGRLLACALGGRRCRPRRGG